MVSILTRVTSALSFCPLPSDCDHVVTKTADQFEITLLFHCMDHIKNGWFSEISELWPGQAMSLQVEEVVYNEKSKFQDVIVFRRWVPPSANRHMYIHFPFKIFLFCFKVLTFCLNKNNHGILLVFKIISCENGFLI